MCGMSLSLSKHNPKPAFVAGNEKWCSDCPHVGFDKKPRECLCNPNFAGVWPVSIHLNAERKKGYMQARAKNARDKGIQNKQMTDPTADAIDKYKKRLEAERLKTCLQKATCSMGGRH